MAAPKKAKSATHITFTSHTGYTVTAPMAQTMVVFSEASLPVVCVRDDTYSVSVEEAEAVRDALMAS